MNTNSSIAPVTPRAGVRALFSSSALGRSGTSLVLGGSAVMLVGSAAVSLLNFGYNVSMARMLGPALFGHLSVLGTLLMLSSAVTLSFQLVCAKFVARNPELTDKSAVYKGLLRNAWAVGIAVGIGLMVLSPPIAAGLRLPTPLLVVILAAAIILYVPLGVRRGALQGLYAFPHLAGNMAAETLIKLVGAVLLVALGFGVIGATGAIAGSVVGAFFLIRVPLGKHTRQLPAVPASFREGMQATIFFIGQVIINNIDIVLVKIFFPADEAGLYAAVALVGRVLYFASWSIVSAMFPVAAAAKDERESRKVVLWPFLLVLGITTVFVIVLHVFSRLAVDIVFGQSFSQAQPLLALYAVATGLYALSVVLMAYEISRKIANTGWLQLLFSGVLIAAISFLHGSLREVIMVQIVLMGILLAVVSVPFLVGPGLRLRTSGGTP